jgi:hypothetical protein
MKKRQGISISKILWLLMAAAMSIFLVQVHVQAATNCLTEGAPDADCDGLKDTEETQIAQCIVGQVPPTIACNATKKDLFVILVPMAGSLLPLTPLGILSTSGIDTTVHQILPTQTFSGSVRNVTSTQKAVRMLEHALVGTYMGLSSQGTPNTTSDDSYVYTKKISTIIDTLCGTNSCVDADGVANTKQLVKDKYVRHTIAHETGHMMKLRPDCSTEDLCHYPNQTNVILDKIVYYTKSGAGKKFYIGTLFTQDDKDKLQLR